MRRTLELSEKLLAGLAADRIERGRALQASGAVIDLRQGRLDDLTVLTGRVRDGESGPHRVYATVEEGVLDGDCSCSLRRDCEHVAALILAAQAPAPSTPSATAPPASAPSAQSMIYLLRLSEDGEELSVCPSRLSPGGPGRAPVVTPYALSRLSDPRQPDYVRDEDLAILHDLADRLVSAPDLVWVPLGTRAHGLLTTLLATGRCHWQSAAGPVLRLADPLVASAQWDLLESGWQRLVLEVSDDDGDALQLPLLPPWRLNPETGRCRPLSTAADSELVAELLSAGAVAPDAIDALLARLAEAPAAFPRPRRLDLVRVDAASPQPCLLLDRAEIGSGQGFVTVPAARLSFRYGTVELDWDDEFSSRLDAQDQVLMVARAHSLEEACCDRLAEAGLAPLSALSGRDYRPGEGGLWVARSADDSERVWIGLQQARATLIEQGWRFQRRPDFALSLIEPDDWYGELADSSADSASVELDLGVIVGGERLSLLPALIDWIEHTPQPVLARIMSGEHPAGQVRLMIEGRGLVLMPIDRLAATLRGLVDCLDATPRLRRGLLRLPRGRLAELAEAAGHWHFGDASALAGLAARLNDFDGIHEHPEPEGLAAELRPYQRLGLGWLQFLREFNFGGILADDMGLGKTLQTLAHILAEKRAGRLDRPALVVAPTSLMFNWRAESRRFAPDLKVLMLHGPERKGRFQWIDESDLVLTTYPLLARDIERLRGREFHLLILDEAQAIKNPRAKVARLVRDLRARHRLCLTGTPLENHLGELWALFDFLMPGLLGSRSKFRRLFQLPIERHDDGERRALLSRRIQPFFLRRRKAEVAPELPPKTEIVRAVALEGQQRRLYERLRVGLHDKLRRAVREQGAEKSRMLVLDALLRLRQLCCDPRLLKDLEGAAEAESAKLDLLMEMLPELIAEGRRVLLFSQFVSMLELIEPALKRHGLNYVKLTGRTRDREQVVARFQAGEVPLFLISLKAGGVGLNLTASDTVIHYDPWWNPAVEDQATDRAHRIGQEQKVFVYRLLTEDTIEQKVFDLQQSKRGLIEGLLGGGGAGALDSADLDALFEPLA